MFANKNTQAAFERYPMAHFTTISKFLREPCRTADFTVSLICTWNDTPVGLTKQQFVDLPLHAVVFVIVHGPPKKKTGKVLLIAEPNVGPMEKKVKWANRIVPFNVVKLIQQGGMGDYRHFVNMRRSEANHGGHCLTLALEWMVEMVVNGFDVERDEQDVVTFVANYRPLRGLEDPSKKRKKTSVA